MKPASWLVASVVAAVLLMLATGCSDDLGKRVESIPSPARTPGSSVIKQSPTQSTPTPHSDEALGDWIAIERSPTQSAPHAYSDEALGKMWDAIRVFFQPDDLGFRCREGFDQKGRFTGMCFRHPDTEGLVSFFYDRGEKGIGVEFFIYEQDSFGVATTALQCAGTLRSFLSLKAWQDFGTGECEATVYADIEATRSDTRDLMDEWYDAVGDW